MGAGHSGVNRVLRGGAWNNHARNVRAANRNGNAPGNRNANIGVRLSQAHDPTGRSVPDPIGIQILAGSRGGEKQMGVGALVGPQSGRERAPARLFVRCSA